MKRLALIALLLPACLTSKAPTMHHDRLDLGEVSKGPSTPAVLTVDDLAVDGVYDDIRIAYRTSDVELERYAYHRWMAPPGTLVADALRNALADTDRLTEVLRRDRSAADLALTGRLFRFEEVDETPTEWKAAIGLELRLWDLREDQQVRAKTFEREEPMEERNPASLARALGRAVAGIVDDVTPDVVDAATPR